MRSGFPWPNLPDVEIDENSDRVRVTLPVERRWGWLALYTILVLVWLGSLILAFITLIRNRALDINLSGLAWFVYVLILLALLFVWFRVGSYIFRWWQHFIATREILVFEKDVLFVRRPVSIFGVTDAYDFSYVRPFFYSERHDSLAFRYGNKGILFGHDVGQSARDSLLEALNERFFPFYDEDEDDEDADAGR